MTDTDNDCLVTEMKQDGSVTHRHFFLSSTIERMKRREDGRELYSGHWKTSVSQRAKDTNHPTQTGWRTWTRYWTICSLLVSEKCNQKPQHDDGVYTHRDSQKQTGKQFQVLARMQKNISSHVRGSVNCHKHFENYWCLYQNTKCMNIGLHSRSMGW